LNGAGFEAKPIPTPPPKNAAKPVGHGREMEQIYRALSKRDLPQARELLTKLIETTPQNLDALFLLAKLSADEGLVQEVHDLLDMIERVDPLVPQAHYLRALLYQQGAAWDEAKTSLRKAIYADRNFALAHYYMGELLYTEGNVKQAQRSWQNAASLLTGSLPDSPVPYGDGTTVGTLLHAIEQRLKKL
jgi:chemotaxis protein methyltransferase CheR